MLQLGFIKHGRPLIPLTNQFLLVENKKIKNETKLVVH